MVAYVYQWLNVQVVFVLSLMLLKETFTEELMENNKLGGAGNTSRPKEPKRRKVKMADFEEMLHETQTYHDVVRIFYEEVISNEDIEYFMVNGTFPKYHGIKLTSQVANFSAAPQVETTAVLNQNKSEHSSILGSLRTESRTMVLDGKHNSDVYTQKTCKTCAKENSNIPQFRHFGVLNKKEKSKSSEKLLRRKGRRKGSRRGRKSRRKLASYPEPDHHLLKDLYHAHQHFQDVVPMVECRLPQPEIVCVRCHSSAVNTVYFPRCTVVTKCKKTSGCCNATSTCAPKTTRNITKHVYVLHFDEDDYVEPARPFVRTFTFEEHSECFCRQIPQIQSCWAMKCPYPYKSRNVDFGCQCQCDSQPGSADRRKCMRIFRGRKKIPKSKIRECKEHKECMTPTCEHGKRFHWKARKCLPEYYP